MMNDEWLMAHAGFVCVSLGWDRGHGLGNVSSAGVVAMVFAAFRSAGVVARIQYGLHTE